LEESTATLFVSHKKINAWLPNGTQTLIDGNGIYIESGIDSSIYVVKDSLYNGLCTSYFRFRNGGVPWKLLPWKLWATGNYSNDKRNGEWIFRDTSGTNSIVLNFENGFARGQCSFYYENTGIICESGYLDDCNRVGVWKKFDETGILTGAYNYENGQKMGACTLYYRDGKIKAKGKYKQVSHTFSDLCEDPNNPGTFVKCKNKYDNVPAKTGIWYFYNENGKLVKIKIFRAEVEELEYCSQIW